MRCAEAGGRAAQLEGALHGVADAVGKVLEHFQEKPPGHRDRNYRRGVDQAFMRLAEVLQYFIRPSNYGVAMLLKSLLLAERGRGPPGGFNRGFSAPPRQRRGLAAGLFGPISISKLDKLDKAEDATLDRGYPSVDWKKVGAPSNPV